MSSVTGWVDTSSEGWRASKTCPVPAAGRAFPPDVAMELVRIACQMPDTLGRSLSLWDCAELARHLMREGLVESISPQTVRRILKHHRLKPWRCHVWMHKKAPRDADFIARTLNICDLYTRDLAAHEAVICVDEKTSIQPRPRVAPTQPAQPDRPVHLEHEYKRCGASNLIAGFNTRTGHVHGRTYTRKRQVEFIDFLESLDRETPAYVTTLHIVCDNVRMHSGKKVRAWLDTHPRFKFHFTPVHCSWMNQVEQWFSILQRKRLRAANFADLQDLQLKIATFIVQWNEIAEPFNWSPNSFSKIIAKAEAEVAAVGRAA